MSQQTDTLSSGELPSSSPHHHSPHCAEPQGPLPEESNSSDQDRALHRKPWCKTLGRELFQIPFQKPPSRMHACAESKPPQASTTIWRPERVCEDHTIDTPQKMLSRSGMVVRNNFSHLFINSHLSSFANATRGFFANSTQIRHSRILHRDTLAAPHRQ